MTVWESTQQPRPLLDVQNLSVVVKLASKARVYAVDKVSFSVGVGETLALVGESGAGKSLTAMALMRLHKSKFMDVEADKIDLEGRDIGRMSDREIRSIRGSKVAMIFQDPLTALNPVLTVEKQLMESILLHNDMSRSQARRRALELLDMVRIPAARSRLSEYSHRLSGGMRQRVMIAMALAGNPKLILADEPTTALDVTISAQILDLLKELQHNLGVGMLFITHDLHAVRSVAHRVAVMYSGRIVETGDVSTVFHEPSHPYTEGLLAARPHGSFVGGGHRLREIPGTVPAPADRPKGCAFGPRCSHRTTECEVRTPKLEYVGRSGFACYHPLQEVSA
jgi:oligopeptide/dipeptide ABC transporter ATP-binding protein